MQENHDAQGGSDTFTPAKIEIDRIQMAEKGAEATKCGNTFRCSNLAGNPNRNHPFCHIA